MANKQSRKKYLAILLASVMTAVFIVSCAQDDGPATVATTTAAPENGDHGGGYEAPQRILPNLPDMDWDGYVFRLMTNNWSSVNWIDWVPRDVAVEELTGNPLNDAVYNRNATLEQRYNFRIEQVHGSTPDNANTTMRNAVRAGDPHFDAISVTMNDTISSAQEGFLVDLHSVNHIDLEKPWWDQGANYGMSIGGRLFLTSGDFVLVNRDACPGLLFNKQLLQDLSLEDPYELVRTNQWTLNKLFEMSRDAGADLDGDGQMTWQNDRFGLIGQRDAVVAYMHGAGERLSRKDANDMPEFVFGTDRSFSVMSIIFELMLNDSAYNLHWIGGEEYYLHGERMFMENRALFKWVRLRIVENLRGMETDFGILPMPKYNSAQENFYHTVNRFTGHAMAIPNFHDDAGLDRVGFMLEAISAESRYTVIPAYYDIQLATQIARDEESGEMLDIIFTTTVWDTAEIYNWGDFSWQLMLMVHDRRPDDLASRLERLEPAIERAMERTIDRFAEIG